MILFVHVLILTIFVNTNLKNLSELIFLSNKRNVFFSCFFWIWWWKSQWWWWWVDDDDDVHTQLDGDDDMMMMLVGLRDVCGWLINGMRLLLVPTWDRLDDALFYWLDLILMMMMMAPATCDPWNRSNPWKIYKFLFLFSLSFFVSFSLFQITYFTTHAHTHLMCTSVNYCHRQRPRPPTSRSQILRSPFRSQPAYYCLYLLFQRIECTTRHAIAIAIVATHRKQRHLQTTCNIGNGNHCNNHPTSSIAPLRSNPIRSDPIRTNDCSNRQQSPSFKMMLMVT